MFCEHQTFANFAMVDQFATIKSAKPKLLLVNTHDPCQNTIVRSQRIKFSTDLAHSQKFSSAKYSSNTVVSHARHTDFMPTIPRSLSLPILYYTGCHAGGKGGYPPPFQL